MRPRIVDWSIFLVVTFQLLTGLGSLLVGRPQGRWIFYVHGAAGLALIVLLTFKFRRVMRRLVRPSLWGPATLVSAGATLAVLATVATGVVWVILQRPLGWPSGMNLHIVFALALAPLYGLHMALRWRLPAAREIRSRRTLLRGLGLLAAGGAAWGLQSGLNRWLGAPGAGRRFTGSSPAGLEPGNAFPITSWMLDNPAPLDPATWRLHVAGAVERQLTVSYPELAARREVQQATLDCTGGWYAIQDWQGVRVGWLLDQVAPRADAVAVSFQSVTGYRWSLPLAEARAALLATHVGGEVLSHGHGAPLRLVAPGRRGFQWVKWLVALEVLTEPDYRKWLAIFSSG
jgi:DMSO/TMAO reductase YedYZ molybdopterin-dependent catalytic subunit